MDDSFVVIIVVVIVAFFIGLLVGSPLPDVEDIYECVKYAEDANSCKPLIRN